ncbi:hydrolase [Flavobacterium suncheonense]|uniref:Amidase n=1 Tax=Flavobacterium suncheonense GH29-5 = DSM 17707 TaxID=1121899 RepID=A0A0A2M3K4_9FLAO|nr:hydrolase [Flavobacterium suncheonense]KGO87192.1 amidase [Flavobacterium suncheonense GH29-5 = DSM 17707]
MSSTVPIRDPKTDHLLSPENSALIIIDYQPVQVSSIKSMDQALLVEQIVRLAKTAKVYNIPVVLSTVNVKTGRNQDTIAPLKEILADEPSYDRTSINAWEDKEFYEAVKATGRKKLIMAALWTEACLTFPALDALKEGFEVYPVVDAVGGTSSEAHNVALRRMEQAGSQLISVNQLLCELQRDWNREETVPGFFQVLFKDGKIH